MEGYNNETNSTLSASPEINWITISVCIAAIVITLFSLLLSIALFLDRRAYEKTRSFLLLNYMFNYTLFAFLFYFRYAHVNIFTNLQRPSCYSIFILCSVFEDGALYFLIPICYDFVVKYLKPSKYESQSFLHTQIILTVVLWVFIWIKALVMILAHSSYKQLCQINLDAGALYFHFAIVVLYVIVLLVFVCLLINIVVKSSRENDTISPLRTIIVIVLVVMILYAAHNILFAGMYAGVIVNLFYIPFLIFLLKFIVVPFLWLSDPTIKQSIRKLCSGKCKNSSDFSPHELTKLR